VAQGDGFLITAEEVAEVARKSQRPPRQILKDMIAFEVLAAEAVRQGTSLEAGERDVLRRLEVQRYLTEVLEPQLSPSRITEKEVRALYDQGRGQYVHPRLVKVALLAVFTGARMKPEARARQEANARALASEVSSRASDRSAALFASLGSDRVWIERQVSSAQVWQAADGDYPYPLAFGAAVARLHQPGDTTPLVCDETGCYLGRYIEERAAENVPFEAVESQLRSQMAGPWQRRRFVELVGELAQRHDIRADPELLAGLDPPGAK